MGSEDAPPRQIRRILGALFSGGLAIGLGTVATLASWSDSEYVIGALGTRDSNLQGSANGIDYSDHLGGIASPAASLSFSAPISNLSPSATAYAPFAVRLNEEAQHDAAVTVELAGLSGNADAMVSYFSVYRTNSFGCSDAADLRAATLILDGGISQASTTFTVNKPDRGAAGEPVNLCLLVKTANEVSQGATGAATWSFQAQSS